MEGSHFGHAAPSSFILDVYCLFWPRGRYLCAIVIQGWDMYAFDAAWARLGAAFVAASAGSSLIVFPLEDHRSKIAPKREPLLENAPPGLAQLTHYLDARPPTHKHVGSRGAPVTCRRRGTYGRVRTQLHGRKSAGLVQAQGGVRPDADAPARERVGGAGVGWGGGAPQAPPWGAPKARPGHERR